MTAPDSAEQVSGVDIPDLVAHIKDSDKFVAVEDCVLNNRAQLPRIMMALYFAAQFCSDPHLSTGEIETITDQLGVRIKMTNVGSAIKANHKFFTAKVVRKAGTKVPYKLNRTGSQAFETVLQGEKL